MTGAAPGAPRRARRDGRSRGARCGVRGGSRTWRKGRLARPAPGRLRGRRALMELVGAAAARGADAPFRRRVGERAAGAPRPCRASRRGGPVDGRDRATPPHRPGAPFAATAPTPRGARHEARVLRRGPSGDDGTLGVLALEGGPELRSMEPPWRDNRRNLSCIPPGEYDVHPHRSPRFGACLLVIGVPGRSRHSLPRRQSRRRCGARAAHPPPSVACCRGCAPARSRSAGFASARFSPRARPFAR